MRECIERHESPLDTTADVSRPSGSPLRSDEYMVAPAATFCADELIAFRYRIIRLIAKGGMGEVYEAEDLELRERIALKVVRRERAEDARAFEQLKREIFLARKVTHPNVCRIFDVGFHIMNRSSRRASGTRHARIPFITMELLEGETLAERLRRAGPMEPEEAIPYIRQMIEALAAAHAAGIIHRDFKSANVCLRERPARADAPGVCRAPPRIHAVVTDFGLARRAPDPNSAFTPSGTDRLMGTPGYMAPEQIEGHPISTATDIYALGVVMYEMFAGARPFASDASLGAALARIERPPPRLREVRPHLDPRLESIVARCMARAAQDRFPSASALHEALFGVGAPFGKGTAFGKSTPFDEDTRGEGASGARRRRVLAFSAMLLLGGSTVLAHYMASEPSSILSASRSTPVAPSAPPKAGAPATPSAAVVRMAAKGGDAPAAPGLDLASPHVRRGSEWITTALAELRARLGLERTPGRDDARALSLEEGKKAYALSMTLLLSREERLLAEGLYREVTGEWTRAADAYRTLFEFFPDKVEYGLALARAQWGSGARDDVFTTLAKVREGPNPPGAELDIDEVEAALALEAGDLSRAEATAARAASLAEERGAWSRAAENKRHEWRALVLQGKSDLARDRRRDAMALFERAGDRRSRAAARCLLAKERIDEGDFDTAVRLLGETENEYHELGDTRSEARSALSHAQARLREGRMTEVAGLLAHWMDLERAMGAPRYRERGAVYMADALIQSGDLAGAQARLHDAMGAVRAPDPRLSAPLMSAQASLLRARGDVAGAVRWVEAALGAAQSPGTDAAVLFTVRLQAAQLLLDQGRAAEAERAASALIAASSPLTEGGGLARAHLVRARALLAQDDVDRARDALGRSYDVANLHVYADIVLMQRIVSARVLAATTHTADRALQALDDVIATAHGLGFWTMELEARWAAGALAVREGTGPGEARQGDARHGEARLRELAQDARSRGYELWAKAANAETSRVESRSVRASGALGRGTSPGLRPRG